jgi:serine/threonine-protein kinase
MSVRPEVWTHGRTQAAIVAAVRQTCEALAFQEPALDDAAGSDEGVVWSWIRIHEPAACTLVLAQHPAIGRAVAATMTGVGPDQVEDGAANDARAELTSIMAGCLARGLLGPHLAFSLALPRCGRGAPDVSGPGWVSMRFRLRDGGLTVWLQGAGDLAKAGHHTVAAAAPAPAPAMRTHATLTAPTGYVSPVSPATLASPIGHPTGPAASDLPERIGPYLVVSRLGEGGMGVVYMAHHPTLDRKVALKVMRPELASSQRFAGRFLREARTAATVDHPHVVTVYDAGNEDGLLYIAMRYMPGGDLSKELHGAGKLPEARVLPLAAQCLLGLQAIAEAGLVHRDIKPANILLEADGTPRLGDLGLARLITADEHASQAGNPQGTPCFMSPEQARSEPQVDIRSDIYALGATIYTALCGEPPFNGVSPYDTVAKVLYEPAPLLSTRLPGVGADVEKLVMTALAKDPAKRWQSPREFLGALEAALEARGLGAVLSFGGRFKEIPRPSAGGRAAE